jgi:Lrp/AsnC family leucine-responsive transcriptional regulator
MIMKKETSVLNRLDVKIVDRVDVKTLDRLDVKILEILQKGCRISNIELANQINLSPTPCLERVRRLEQRGYIEKYVAHLNPAKLDVNLTVYVMLSLRVSSTSELQKFNREVLLLDEVVECVLIAGGFDYLLKIRTADIESYQKFLGGSLAIIEGVISTHTYVVMENVKSTHLLPIKTRK